MSNMGEVYGKVSQWIDKITGFRLEFYYCLNTDRLIRIADELSYVRPEL